MLSAMLSIIVALIGPTTLPAMTSLTYEGVQITYPQDWVTREVAQLGGLMIICPKEEAGIQANVFIEVRDDAQSRPVKDLLDDLEKNLRERKRNLKISTKELRHHPSGEEYGLIVYTCDDVSATNLAGREAIIPLRDGRRVYVMASTATKTREKYESIFEQIVSRIAAK